MHKVVYNPRLFVEGPSDQKPQSKTGHWIGLKEVEPGVWDEYTVLVNSNGCVTEGCRCSECDEWLIGSDEYNCKGRYCPNCGIKMESEDVKIRGKRSYLNALDDAFLYESEV